MGIKLMWTGLAIIASTPVIAIPAAAIVGSVFMAIGCVLMWMDK